MTYDVFISYSSKDQKIVEGICGYLEARGIRCFVSYRDIPPGVVWARAIVEALDESHMMVVAFSDNFNRSDQVDREIELASEDRKPILTFRLSDSKFEGAKKYYLKNLNWIDAFPSPDDAFGELYKNICKLIGKEEVIPVTTTNITNPSLSTEAENPSKISKLSSESQSSAQSSETTSASQTSNQPVSTPSTSSKLESQTNTIASQLEFDAITGVFRQKGSNGGTTSVSEDNPLSTKVVQAPKNGFINGHEYVDLGLPSGLKWATSNIGAFSAEDSGDYFAWGQTSSKVCFSKIFNPIFNKEEEWLRKNGYINDKGNLTLNHDAAHSNWGASWRMPTSGEIAELKQYTTWEWVILQGWGCVKLTSKTNGNFIILPAAGLRENFSRINFNSSGWYWTSTPFSKEIGGKYKKCSEAAYQLWFYKETFTLSHHLSFKGLTIRPVSD